jgi:hypothetical protein
LRSAQALGLPVAGRASISDSVSESWVLIEENFLEGGAEPEAERLERSGAKAELLEGDFLTKPLSGPFEAILARPLDYTPEPERFARQVFELSSGAVVANFRAGLGRKGRFGRCTTRS